MATESTSTSASTTSTGSEQAAATEPTTGTGTPPDAPSSPSGDTSASGGTTPETSAGAQKGATDSVPESYEFVAPDGVTFDDNLLKDVEAFAREHSLPNASAQKIADMGLKLQSNFVASLNDAVKVQQDQWQEALRGDPEIGGEKLEEMRGVAALAVTTYFPELNEYLEKSGLMHNPALIKGLVRIGKTLRQDTPPGGSESRNTPAVKSYYNHPTSKHAA
jgi:hypothetical protein